MAEPFPQRGAESNILAPALICNEVFFTPLRHSRSTSSRVPSAVLAGSVHTLYLNHRGPPRGRGNAKESSSGSGKDDGGSLAGKLSAIVLSIIFSLLACLESLSMTRSSGSRGMVAPRSFIVCSHTRCVKWHIHSLLIQDQESTSAALGEFLS